MTEDRKRSQNGLSFWVESIEERWQKGRAEAGKKPRNVAYG